MNEEEKTLNAIGAKTARACDSCSHKKARWYCAADDAFLCQACDTSVHSANQLARRHERIRLEGSSLRFSTLNVPASVSWPKKTRTPRPHKIIPSCAKQDRVNKENDYLHGKEAEIFFEPDVVPEIGCEEGLLASPRENEDQLIYQVPVIGPFMEEEDPMIQIGCEVNDLDGANELEIFPGLSASNLDFEDFDGDMEGLLGKNGVDDNEGDNDFSNCEMRMDYLLPDIGKQSPIISCDFQPSSSLAKVKNEDLCVAREFDNSELAFEGRLHRPSQRGVGKEEDREKAMTMVVEEKPDTVGRKFLSLNYNAVLAAWDSQGSPWITGRRPDFDPINCLPTFTADTTFLGAYNLKRHGRRSDDRERGAKVSRYREKRRSRLFSKKIRYEVRRLNAEKRPRMKGRFVKRSSFGSSTAVQVPLPFAYLNYN